MNNSVNQRLRHVLDIHFDHNTGSPYWLEKQKHLDLDVRKEIRTIDDLPRLGAMDENALANRPIEDFISQKFSNCTEYFIAETAGTLGRPKTTVHRHDEFHDHRTSTNHGSDEAGPRTRPGPRVAPSRRPRS